MIYLIDDNQNNLRQKNYNLTFIEEGVFSGYLTSIEKLEKGKSFTDISHLEFLRSANCILLHSTTEDFDLDKGFISGSNNNVIKIKELISQEGEIIPLVLFSNSMGDPQIDNDSNPKYIRQIKKNLFYERLYDFLNHYKLTGEINLKIISLGKNYLVTEVSKFIRDILELIDKKDNKEIVSISDLSSRFHEIEALQKLVWQEATFDQIIEEIKNCQIDVSELRNKLNKVKSSYLKYGKNIYPWK
jgi:hypothetical protein